MHKKKKRSLVIYFPYNKINSLIWVILSFKQKKIQNQYMGTQKKYGMVFEVRSSSDYSQ
jgi:hypothetical protein